MPSGGPGRNQGRKRGSGKSPPSAEERRLLGAWCREWQERFINSAERAKERSRPFDEKAAELIQAHLAINDIGITWRDVPTSIDGEVVVVRQKVVNREFRLRLTANPDTAADVKILGLAAARNVLEDAKLARRAVLGIEMDFDDAGNEIELPPPPTPDGRKPRRPRSPPGTRNRIISEVRKQANEILETDYTKNQIASAWTEFGRGEK